MCAPWGAHITASPTVPCFFCSTLSASLLPFTCKFYFYTKKKKNGQSNLMCVWLCLYLFVLFYKKRRGCNNNPPKSVFCFFFTVSPPTFTTTINTIKTTRAPNASTAAVEEAHAAASLLSSLVDPLHSHLQSSSNSVVCDPVIRAAVSLFYGNSLISWLF